MTLNELKQEEAEERVKKMKLALVKKVANSCGVRRDCVCVSWRAVLLDCRSLRQLFK